MIPSLSGYCFAERQGDPAVTPITWAKSAFRFDGNFLSDFVLFVKNVENLFIKAEGNEFFVIGESRREIS